MSHRRSSIESGGVDFYNDAPPKHHKILPQVPPQQVRRAPPRRVDSIDAAHPDDIRRASDRRRGYSSTNFNSFEGNSYVDNSPIAQSAKATAHRAAEVIEEHVLKRVKVPEEVYGVLHEIERSHAYQTARGGVHKAYTYVEPILSRVASVEADDTEPAGPDSINFIIPPQASNSRNPSPVFSRPIENPISELQYLKADSFQRQNINESRDSVPEIKISDVTGRSSIVSQQDLELLKDKPVDTISVTSGASSERYYEIIKPNKLYSTVPHPPPSSKKRRSLLGKSASAETPSTTDTQTKKINDKLKKSQTLQDCGDCAENECQLVVDSKNKSRPRRLQRQDTTVDSDTLQGSSEGDPLLPKKTKVKGIPESELREHLKDKLHSVVCINGKNIYY